jgi:hypothetical protein
MPASGNSVWPRRRPVYAFDLLALDGDNLRRLPLSMRKTNFKALLQRRPQGIFPATFERGEIGPDLFKAASRMGIEGLVSKHVGRAYGASRAEHWIEVKNRAHAAFKRGAPTASRLAIGTLPPSDRRSCGSVSGFPNFGPHVARIPCSGRRGSFWGDGTGAAPASAARDMTRRTRT